MDLHADLTALSGYPVLCMYNANVDAIRRADDDLESILGTHGDVPAGPLSTKAELAAAIVETMRHGEGDERAMTDAFASELEAELEADEQRLGGQAGIMSDVLSVLGGAPVLYTYLLSDRQRSRFSHPERIRFPALVDGELTLASLDDAPTSMRTKLNWIFEFDAGETFFGETAADASRFIAASRPDEFDLHTPVDSHARELGERVGCAVLSGFHSVKRSYDDDREFEECLDNAASVVRDVAANARVQVELGVTHDREIRRAVRERIVPEADVVSLDGHELNQVRDDLGIERPAIDDKIVRRYTTLERVRESLGVSALSFHAKHYFLATFDDDYLPPEAVRRGFDFAACVAAAKAEDGLVTGREDLSEALDFRRTETGTAQVDSLAAHLDRTAADGIAAPGVAAVANRVVDSPASTVGIGDSVSVTSFALACAVADDVDC